MPGPGLYETERFMVTEGEKITTKLTFALWLEDDYTREAPLGHIRLSLKDRTVKPRKNLNGYYCFTDLPHGEYEISIESEYYHAKKERINTAELNPKNPVKKIILVPNATYPFPAHATLVRGLLKDTEPVKDAEIKVTGHEIRTRTNSKGEFVLYFKGIKSEKLTIKFTKEDKSKRVEVTVKEGETTSLGIVSFS